MVTRVGGKLCPPRTLSRLSGFLDTGLIRMFLTEMLELCVAVGVLVIGGRVLVAWLRDREFF